MLVIACGAIAREIVQLKRLNGWEHVELTCIPAQYHNTPQKIPAAVRDKLEAARAQNKPAFVAFADCGTGGLLDAVLAEYQVERLPGAHCYQFFAGTQAFLDLHEEELGTLYLTDFLARHFEAFIIKGLGIDKHPELQSMYFAHYKRLVYLAQAPNDDLVYRAEKAAERLGLDYVYHPTGYGELATTLATQLGGSYVR